MIESLKKARSLKKVFKQFSDINDLVYFGSVDQADADEPITGITFSSRVSDSHFMHGMVNDYDVSLLQRQTTLSHPHHASDTYDWSVLRLKLKLNQAPHIFIDAHRYDELLYKDIFTKFAKLRLSNSQLSNINQSFTDYFQVFSAADMAWQLVDYLPDQIMQRLLTNFQDLDVEIFDDTLWVYQNGFPERVEQLQKMLDEAMWFAEHLERVLDSKKP